jgi:hypothetical protein
MGLARYVARTVEKRNACRIVAGITEEIIWKNQT